MPTNEEIAAARARGSEADALMEELLLAEQQQQQAFRTRTQLTFYDGQKLQLCYRSPSLT